MVRAIAMTRASGMGPLPAMLEERGGMRALQRAFDGEGLPLALREQLELPIPALAMVNLFERGARLLGDRTLGLEVGIQMTYAGYGAWVEYAAGAVTLRDGIVRVNATTWAHQSGAYSLALTPERGRWVWRVRRHGPVTPCMQHSDHLIPPMVSFARLYLGRHWNPAWVEVDYPKDPDAALLEEGLRAPVQFGRPGVAIVFTADELARTRISDFTNVRRALTLREVWAEAALKHEPEPVRSISAIVSLRLLDGGNDIEGVARLAGMSVRSLQRQLRLMGYTYREVLASCRRARAMALLRETNFSVSEIALSLGYEEHANFSRAFHRWLGCSPTDFRANAKS